jgi:hypothetical protein
MDRLQRLRERAFWLPIAGMLLLSPPILAVFGRSITVGGVPLLFVYILGVWLGLIALGRLAARALQRHAAEMPDPTDQGPVIAPPPDPRAGPAGDR